MSDYKEWRAKLKSFRPVFLASIVSVLGIHGGANASTDVSNQALNDNVLQSTADAGFSRALSEDAFQTGQAGDWVVQQESPKLTKQARTLARNGVYYRLFDKQINAVDAQNRQVYIASERLLTNQNGVRNQSQIEIEFDPIYESIVVHELALLRDDRYIDKLPSTELELLRSEKQLDDLLYNGTSTLTAILDDVRVGDTLRYSYTRHGSNPSFGSIIEHGMGAQYSVAMGKASFRMLVDEQTPMVVRSQFLKNGFRLKESVADGVRTYEWSRSKLKALKYVDDEPVWTETDPSFSVSSLDNWGEIVDWFLPMYQAKVSSTDELSAVAKKISRRHITRKAQIGAALQWVQNEIRYFGVELGDNSHKPSPPHETLSRRFGDCKDKTILLVSLLKELGFEAEPALVNTRQYLRNTDYIYRLHAFNHVLVHIEHEGQSHWLDPTMDNQQGALGEFYEPDFGFALILKEGSNELVPMSEYASLFELSLSKRIEINEKDDSFAQLHVKSTRNSLSAENFRRHANNVGFESLSENYLDYYRNYFNYLYVRKPIRHTEYPRNKSYTVEQYDIKELWLEEDGERYFELYADEVRHYLTAPDSAQYRKRPYLISHPVKVREVSTIQLTGGANNQDARETISNDMFTLTVSVLQDKDSNELTFVHDYETHAAVVKPEYMKTYLADIERAREISSFYIYPHGLGWDSEEESNDSTESDDTVEAVADTGVE